MLAARNRLVDEDTALDISRLLELMAWNPILLMPTRESELIDENQAWPTLFATHLRARVIAGSSDARAGLWTQPGCMHPV